MELVIWLRNHRCLERCPETLSITDRAYLLFEGKILFQGTSEELAENPIVKEKYLGRNFVFHRKKFD